MKKIGSTITAVLLGVLLSGVTALTVQQDEAEKANMIKLADAPQAVQQALATLQRGIQFEELEVEDESGAKLYTGVWERNGVTNEISVDGSGELVELETSMKADAVPAAVLAAARVAFPKGELAFEKKTMIFYEAEVMIDGEEHAMLLSPSGHEMEIENEAIEDDDEDGDDDDEDEDGDDDDDDDDDDGV